MIYTTQTIVYISIWCILMILAIIVISLVVYNKRKKDHSINTINKDAFIDIKPLSSDDLLEKLKLNPEGLQEVVALDNLTEFITNTINSKLEEVKNNNIPIGTIIMWDKPDLPSDKWAWCDGKNNTPDLRYRFPLGDVNDPSVLEQVKPDPAKNDGLIDVINVPKHSHPLKGDIMKSFPSLKHKHEVTISEHPGHSHKVYVPKSAKDEGDGMVFEPANTRKGAVALDTTNDGRHNHNLTIADNLIATDTEIKNWVNESEIGKGPIYPPEPDGSEPIQKPFYPRYTLIYFIIKIA